MTHLDSVSGKEKPVRTWLRLACLTMVPMALLGAPRSEVLPVVPKWARFEQSFSSTTTYSNALQQATLTVVFTSPLGETNLVYGFWDGGRIWRVRFSPNQPGRWSYATTCSDPSNKGLLRQTGAFLCTAASGQNRFTRHGPVRIARDHRHFEHADGTPFFWIADSAWNGARVSEPGDWELYARVRAAQKFSAVQWSVAPGEERTAQRAFSGKDPIAINPDFFRRLDPKVSALNEAGLLSVITPVWTSNSRAADAIREDQFALLLRYLVARYGSDNVAWLLAFDAGSPAQSITRYREAGRAVFAGISHAPVVLFAGETFQALNEFRNENWIDAFGYGIGRNLDDDSLKGLLSGPLLDEWKKEPPRPLINIVPPYENAVTAQPGKRIDADEVRRVLWWSLLIAPPAGVSYGAEGVVNWNTTNELPRNGVTGSDLPIWHKSLFLPGARQMSTVASVLDSAGILRLRPSPQGIALQPGSKSLRRFIAAAGTETKDLNLIYVPEDRTVKLPLEALPGWPAVGWINPRTGEKSPAVAVVEDRACHFATPDPGDWLLVIRAGK